MRPRDWAIVAVIVVGAGVAVVWGTYFVGMRMLFDYAPDIPEGPTFRVAVGYPKADAWANGDRSVVCAAISKGERWSSVRD